MTRAVLKLYTIFLALLITPSLKEVNYLTHSRHGACFNLDPGQLPSCLH